MFAFRKLNLRGKLILLLLTMAVFTLLVSTSFFVFHDLDIFKKNLVQHIKVLGDAAGNMSRAAILFDDPKRAKEILESLFHQENQIEFAALYDSKGKAVVRYNRNSQETFQDPSLKKTDAKFLNSHFELISDIFLKNKRIGQVYIYANMDEFNAQLIKNLYWVGLILIVTLIGSFALSIPLQSIISKPIISLAAMEKKVSQKGDYSLRAFHDSADEIGILYQRFNEMLSQIEVRDKDLVQYKQHLEVSCDQLRDLNKRLQAIREEESSRISREVHDELGQMLTALKMDLTALKNMPPHPQKMMSEKIEKISKFVDQTIDTVRKIATDLRPEVLDHLGLSEALEWYAEEFQDRMGRKWEFEFDLQEISIDSELAMALFRIYQESLTNIARHANAKKINVILASKQTKLILEIQDNGVGMTNEDVPKYSLGLMGMKERARVWNGKVTLFGNPDFGTSIKVEIPLDEQKPSVSLNAEVLSN